MRGAGVKLGVAVVALLTSACEPSADGDSNGQQSSHIVCNGISDCETAVEELKRADAAMDQVLDDAIARIQSCRGQNTTRCYDWQRAIKLIESEQQAWLAWRTAHCDVFAFDMEGTSAEGSLRAFCRNDLAKKRTEELDKIMRPEE